MAGPWDDFKSDSNDSAPWEEFSLQQPEESKLLKVRPPPGKLEALLRGGAQGATFGFGDEITGALESGKPYAQSRDEAREANEKAQAEHPYMYGAGQLAGGVAGALPFGLEALGAKGAIALGGMAGLGNSKADLTKNDLAGAAKDTAIGGAIGGVVNKVAAPLTNLVAQKTSPVTDYLANKSDLAASYLRSPVGQQAAANAGTATGGLMGLTLGGPAGHLGRVSGALVGGRIGKYLGPKAASGGAMALNSAADKLIYTGGAIQGGAVGMAAQNLQVPTQETINAKVTGTKYAPVFQNAQNRNGENATAANYFLLGQSDPEFRKLFQEEQ